MTHQLRRRGISLVDTLLSVTILGILAATVIPSMSTAGTQRLEAVGRILASDLTYARSLAIQYNTNWSISFDLTNNTYQLNFAGTGTAPVTPVNPRDFSDSQTAAYLVQVERLGGSTVASNGVRLAGIAGKTTQSHYTTVTFGPLGGTGPARSEDTVIWITEGAGSETKYLRITLSWVTGQVWLDRPDMLGNGTTVFL